MTSIASSPGALRLFATSIVARLPLEMLGIGLLVHAQQTTGSFTAAGVVAGAYALAVGGSGPLVGRLVDRRGQTSVLLVASGAAAVLLIAIAMLPAGAALTVLVALAAGVGLATPPIGACLRTQLPALLRDPGAVGRAFALEASLVELTYICGPPLALGVAAVWSTGAALAVAGLVLLAATAVFAAQPASRRWRPTRAALPAPGGSLGTPAMRTLVIVLVAVGMLLGADEVAVIAAAKALHSTVGAAPLFAVWGAGSFLGGLLMARRGGAARTSAGLAVLLGGLAAGHLALIPADGNMLALGAVLLLAGAAIAPTEATLYTLVDAAAPDGTVTEAFAWLATAMAVGAAAGSAGAGLLVDRAGPAAGFALGGGAGVLAVLTSLLRARSLDLAGGAPETGTPDGDLDGRRQGARRAWPTAAVAAVTLVISVVALSRPALMHLFTRDLSRLRAGQWWRVVTPLLVQPSGWGQVGFNLLGIALVGAALQRRFGWASWSLVYLAGGSGSIAVYSAWHPADTGGGSSAAVAALVEAFLVALNVGVTGHGRGGRLEWLAQLYGVFFAVYLTALDLSGVTVSIVAGNLTIVVMCVARRAVGPVMLARASVVVVSAAGIAMILARDDHGVGLAVGGTLAGLVLARRSLLSRPAAGRWRQTAVAVPGVVAAAWLTWFGWVELLGVPLVARSSQGRAFDVTGLSVALVAAGACLAASATLGLLSRHSPARGRRIWTGLCLGVALLSVTGPLALAVGTAGVAALISLHLACATAILALLAPPGEAPCLGPPHSTLLATDRRASSFRRSGASVRNVAEAVPQAM